jgi:hypothetical protein
MTRQEEFAMLFDHHVPENAGAVLLQPCAGCAKPTRPCELHAYGGRCEDCYQATAPSVATRRHPRQQTSVCF